MSIKVGEVNMCKEKVGEVKYVNKKYVMGKTVFERENVSMKMYEVKVFQGKSV